MGVWQAGAEATIFKITQAGSIRRLAISDTACWRRLPILEDLSRLGLPPAPFPAIGDPPQLPGGPSGLPSFLDSTEHAGKYRLRLEQFGELLDQRQQAVFRHGWDELVEHDALAQQ